MLGRLLCRFLGHAYERRICGSATAGQSYRMECSRCEESYLVIEPDTLTTSTETQNAALNVDGLEMSSTLDLDLTTSASGPLMEYGPLSHGRDV